MFHHQYFYHAHHAGSFIDMIISAVTHALIYGFVYKLMRSADLPTALIIAMTGIACAFIFWRRRA